MFGSPFHVNVRTLTGHYRSVCTLAIWLLSLQSRLCEAQFVIHQRIKTTPGYNQRILQDSVLEATYVLCYGSEEMSRSLSVQTNCIESSQQYIYDTYVNSSLYQHIHKHNTAPTEGRRNFLYKQSSLRLTSRLTSCDIYYTLQKHRSLHKTSKYTIHYKQPATVLHCIK